MYPFNKGLKGQLLLWSFIQCALLLALSLLMNWSLGTQTDSLKKLGHERLPKAVLIVKMRLNENALVRYLLTSLEESDPNARKQPMEKAKTKIVDFKAAFEKFVSFQHSEETLKLLAPVSDNLTLFTSNANEALILLDKNDKASDAEAKNIIFQKLIPVAKIVSTALGEINDVSEKHTEEFIATADASSSRLKLISLIFCGIAIVGLTCFGIIFSNRTSATLLKTANTLSRGAEDVASATTELSTTSSALSSGATEQAAALQETAASIEELSAMVRKNAENAQQSSEFAQQGQNSANEGIKVVEEMISAIGEISTANTQIMQQIESSNRDISEIVKLIEHIGEKTKVINDIVFQTRLLSFNASVESARAGEHGKGFAVVAEEVGNLAQMSGTAANEITNMLHESISKVNSIVHNTQSRVEQLITVGKEKVDAGVIVAKRCGDTLQELSTKVGSVNEMVLEISNATNEQAQGIQEIIKATHELDKVTQQNSAASQESANAANSLSQQALVLSSSAQNLLSMVTG